MFQLVFRDVYQRRHVPGTLPPTSMEVDNPLFVGKLVPGILEGGKVWLYKQQLAGLGLRAYCNKRTEPLQASSVLITCTPPIPPSTTSLPPMCVARHSSHRLLSHTCPPQKELKNRTGTCGRGFELVCALPSAPAQKRTPIPNPHQTQRPSLWFPGPPGSLLHLPRRGALAQFRA